MGRVVAIVVVLGALAGVSVGSRGARADEPGPPVPSGYRVAGEEVVDVGASHLTLRAEAPAQRLHVARMAPGLVDRLGIMIAGDQVAGRPRAETVASMCLRVRCLLAVNGDYADLATYGNVGPTVIDGELVRSEGIRMALFGVDAGGNPSITHDPEWPVSVEVTGGDPVAVASVNRARHDDGIVLFTPRFGPSTLTGPDGVELVLELPGASLGAVGADGTPVRLVDRHEGGDARIGAGRVVLFGRGAGGERLDEVWREAQASGRRDGVLRVGTGGMVDVVAGSPTLVRAGRPELADNPDPFTRSRHPRTMVGWTASGELLLVTADGRRPGTAEGLTLHEAADLLVDLGAVEAMNLDGGGSTTFVVNSSVVNGPSGVDDREREVTSALVLLPVPGTVATATVRDIGEACPPGDPTAADQAVAGFLDVGPTLAHHQAIACAVRWSLTAGATTATFEPTRQVDRAQMATFIARLVLRAGGTLPDGSVDRYDDDGSSVHQENINRLAAAGIVTGRADGGYGPEEPVTRAQMASLLVRAYEHRTGRRLEPSADYFADDANDIHERAVNQLALAGVTGGRGHPHLFAPGAPVQRDQMASFLSRLLALLVSEGEIAPAT